jgi:hypothetical protein
MDQIGDVQVRFIAGFGPIVREPAASRKLYSQALGIGFKEEDGGYLHTEALKGANSFALWPLSQAAQSCFGKDSWPAEIAPPQSWLEFDVDSVEEATAALESKGYRMLVKNKKRAVGPDGKPFLGARRIIDRDHIYAVDAGRSLETATGRRSRPPRTPHSRGAIAEVKDEEMGNVVALAGGEAALHPAASGDDPELRPQPPHPSPRSLVRLSPPERHPGSRNVRPVGR